MANRKKIENLEELIRESVGGRLVGQTVTPLLPPGENYGSVIYKVDFKVINESEEEEDYHAVAKCTPPNPVTQELFNTQESFKAEIAWYTTVIPTLKQFAKDRGLKRELNFFQKFYGARISLDPHSERVDLDGVILTENLKYLGYKNVDRHVGFDLSTTYSALRDLATFHATPLALRMYDRNRFDEQIKPHLPTWSTYLSENEADFKKDVFKIYEHIPEVQHLADRLRKTVDASVMYGHRSGREPWITILHLDFWVNNIMVTEEADPKIIILDLQCPGYGSPAADVIFFLLTSVRTDIIERKLDDFLHYYHRELTENLRQLGVPTDEFSFEAFSWEVDIEARDGEFAHALTHINFMLSEKGVTTMDAADDTFKYEDFASSELEVNDRHVAKYKWATKEAEARRWI